MAWSALIVTGDADALESLASAAQDLGIATEARGEVQRAVEAASAHKYDLLVFDCDLAAAQGGHELLRGLRAISVNLKLVVVALVSDPGDMQATFEHGANFVIHKPLTKTVVQRTLRAAACVLHRSARKFPRREVDTLALVQIDGASDKAMLMELGEGGMGLQALEQLEVRRPLHLHFEIPGTELPVDATGEIAWADASGRVGVRFVEIEPESRARVRDWVLNESLGRAAAGSAAASTDANALNDAVKPPAGLLLRSGHPRILAAMLDTAIVLGATAIFELMVLGMVQTAPHTMMGQAMLIAVPCLFWTVYQYLFLHGATPGAKLARKAVLAAAGRSKSAFEALKSWSAPVLLRLDGHGGTPVTISR